MASRRKKFGIEKDRSLPGYVVMTVNGVEMEIVSRSSFAHDPWLKMEKERGSETFVPLGGGRYWECGPYMNRDDLYRAAGYDMKKIDFSVPIGWLRLPEIQQQYQKGDRAVWSYEGHGNNMGKPVWDKDALRRLKGIVKRRLAIRK